MNAGMAQDDMRHFGKVILDILDAFGKAEAAQIDGKLPIVCPHFDNGAF